MASCEKYNESDVTLEVDGEKFHCNKNDLAKQSPYFKAMFSDNFMERHKDVIKIQDVDAAAMRFLLQWINDTSQIDSLQGEEILVVLQAAAMLQFEHLQHSCEEVVVQRWLSPENCLLTAATADQLSLNKLYKKSSALALWHFSQVRHTQAFLDLPLNAAVWYLSQDALSLGPAPDEFQVFEAASCWVEHNMRERHSKTVDMLSCVRMNFISISDIESMLNYACIDSCKNAQLLLKCIISIREGRNVSTIENETSQSETSYSMEDKTGCCEPFKKITDHLKACGSETLSEASSVMMEGDDGILNENVSITEFSACILSKAQHILSIDTRLLPIVACIIGHVMDAEETASLDEETCLPKKNRKGSAPRCSPYIFYWNSCKSGRPVPLLPLTKINEGPNEAVGYTVLSRGQDLLVIGGEYLLGHGNWNKSIWKYNVWNETWSYETSLTIPRRHHSVVCLDDDLYVIGGFGKFRVIMDSMDKYNFGSRTWQKCAPLPSSLYSAAACVHNNSIYVISCQIFCYYPASNTWATISDITIPVGSSFNTAMSYGRQIFLTGLHSPNLLCFDPIAGKSVDRVGSFQNCAGFTCLVGDTIYSFTEDDERPCVEVYDIKLGVFNVLWKGTHSDDKFSFNKLRGCFPLVLYDSLWHGSKNL